MGIIEGYNIREDREFFRFGIVASVIANCNRNKDKNPRAFTPSDFIPKKDVDKKKQKWEDQLEMVKLLNIAYGGEDETKAGD